MAHLTPEQSELLSEALEILGGEPATGIDSKELSTKNNRENGRGTRDGLDQGEQGDVSRSDATNEHVLRFSLEDRVDNLSDLWG